MRRVLTALTLTFPILLLIACPALAQTPAPVPMPSFFNASGAVCSGCLLETYASGTSTPLQTWTDSALSVAHANPIVLNSVGRPPAVIFLSATAYKFVLTTSTGTVIWTADSIQAVPAANTGVSNTADITFQVDSDNNGSNVFSFLNGASTQVAVLSEAGDLQIDDDMTIGDGSAVDKDLIFDAFAQDFYICNDESVADLVIGLGSSCGTTPAISIDNAQNTTLHGGLTLTGASPQILASAAVGTNIILAANGDVIVDLDNNADGTETFQIRDGADATVFTVLESGAILAAGTVQTNTSFQFDLDEDNNGTSTFEIRDGANAAIISLTEAGAMTFIATLFANLGTPGNGAVVYCSDCAYNANPCTGSSTGAFAKRVAGAWRCD